MSDRQHLILGLAIAVGGAVGLWFLLDWAVTDVLPNLNPNVSAALVVGIIATGTTLWAKRVENRHAIETQFREEKLKLFVQFRDHFDRLSGPTPPSSNQTVKFLKGMKTKVLFWSNPKLVNQFASLMSGFGSMETVGDLVDAGRKLGECYLAMRKDLGLSNRGLSAETLGINMMMRHPDLALKMAKEKPGTTIDEMVRMEKELERNE